MSEVKIYYPMNDAREIHTIGDYVSVMWGVKSVEEIRREGNKRIITITYERCSGPCIKLVQIRPYPYPDIDGCYVVDGGVLDGIVPIAEAKKIIKELQWACEYLEAQQ